jgi:hypothetical protein
MYAAASDCDWKLTQVAVPTTLPRTGNGDGDNDHDDNADGADGADDDDDDDGANSADDDDADDDDNDDDDDQDSLWLRLRLPRYLRCQSLSLVCHGTSADGVAENGPSALAVATGAAVDAAAGRNADEEDDDKDDDDDSDGNDGCDGGCGGSGDNDKDDDGGKKVDASVLIFVLGFCF